MAKRLRTRAELASDAIVRRFYDDMKNPETRGRFDPKNFNIEKWVDTHLHIYYRQKCFPIQRIRDRATNYARTLWNKLWGFDASYKIS